MITLAVISLIKFLLLYRMLARPTGCRSGTAVDAKHYIVYRCYIYVI